MLVVQNWKHQNQRYLIFCKFNLNKNRNYKELYKFPAGLIVIVSVKRGERNIISVIITKHNLKRDFRWSSLSIFFDARFVRSPADKPLLD